MQPMCDIRGASVMVLFGIVVLAGCDGGVTGGSGRNDANVNANAGETESDDTDELAEDVWLEGSGIAIEVDNRSALRVYLRDQDGKLDPLTAPLDEVDPTGRLVVEGNDVDDFVVTNVTRESAAGSLGPGERLTVDARSDSSGVRRVLVLETADAHPGVVLTRTRYISDDGQLEIDTFIEHDFELQALDPPDSGSQFWSFQGGPQAWGQDDVFPLVGSQSQRNEYPLYGGVPFCDVWSRGGGLGLGSASAVPRRLTIPVRATDGLVWMSLEWPERTLVQGVEVEAGAALLVAHTGDFYVGCRAYAAAMADLGVAPAEIVPSSAYLQHWETYGYLESFTVEDVTSRLQDLVELGIGVVTIDSGWYEDFLTGDYVPDPALFPEGDDDVRALTDAIHAAGLKAKLWWEPGNAEFESQLAAEHPGWLVRDEDGQAVRAPVPDNNDDELTDFALCPAIPEVIEFHRDFVRKAIQVWGFDGFKMDYIYGVPRCYAEDHDHDSPDDALTAYPDIYEAIAETAQELRPDAMLNVCNCGVPQNFYLYPHQNQLITSDPIGSRQMRYRTKVLKAFFGASAPVLCDHVELSVLIDAEENERDDDTPDFASCLGVGAVLQTKYTAFDSDVEWDWYWKWLTLGKKLELSSGEYLGELYDYGFDQPEAHALRKEEVIYYGFFVEPWGATYTGPVELRGLGAGTYRVERYVEDEHLGTVEGPLATLDVSFENSLLVRAVPAN